MDVQKKSCNQCLFGKNHVVSGKARVREVINECLMQDTYFQCHKATIKDEDVCCRAFWDAFKDELNYGRIIQRLGGPKFVTVD